MSTTQTLNTSSLAIAFATRMRYAEDFDTYGALQGRHERYGVTSLGRLPEEYHASVRNADYIVYSYRTPIAWRVNGTWYAPEVKYSVTTSRHQSKIRAAISLI